MQDELYWLIVVTKSFKWFKWQFSKYFLLFNFKIDRTIRCFSDLKEQKPAETKKKRNSNRFRRKGDTIHRHPAHFTAIS